MTFNRPFIIRHGSQEERIKHACCSFIQNLEPEEGREFEVNVKIYKSKRSLEQNAYLHGPVIQTFSSETGYHPDECKEVLRRMFLPVVGVVKIPRHFDEYRGVMVEAYDQPIHQSTTKLNTKEMAKFIDDCVLFIESQGFIIPPKPWVRAE